MPLSSASLTCMLPLANIPALTLHWQFTDPSALSRLGVYLRGLGAGGATDIAILHNPGKRTAFDDLNWGLVWMSSTAPTIALLECTLSSWEHKAFAQHRDDPPLWEGSMWYDRSQPRINHLIESSFAAARGAGQATGSGSKPRVPTASGVQPGTHAGRSVAATEARAPRVCLLPSALVASLRHATVPNGGKDRLKGGASFKVNWLLQEARKNQTTQRGCSPEPCGCAC